MAPVAVVVSPEARRARRFSGSPPGYRVRVHQAPAAIAVLCLLLAGCGGGGDEASPPASSSTAGESGAPRDERAAYIKKADALCSSAADTPEGRAVARSLEKLEGIAVSEPKYAETAAAHFRNVLKLARAFGQDLKAIEPPAEDRARIEAFHRANDQAVARLEDVIQSLEKGDDPRPAFDGYLAALGTAAELAESYGFEVCGRNDT